MVVSYKIYEMRLGKFHRFNKYEMTTSEIFSLLYDPL